MKHPPPIPGSSDPVDRSIFTRLLAADERKLPGTFIGGLVLVGLTAWLLNLTIAKDTWTHAFFFGRSFVQWVLLCAFFVGFVHLVRRIPEWLREKAALRAIQRGGALPKHQTLVHRRWLKCREELEASLKSGTRISAKAIAEHDEAEVDAAYRMSGDIVQVLPLIGFFGTVFGLSHGLYQSFLATGGATTKDFAKAIAVAFDNTLLGLALTILLFIFHSLLRKREEALLLQLNLAAEEWLEPGRQSRGERGGAVHVEDQIKAGEAVRDMCVAAGEMCTYMAEIAQRQRAAIEDGAQLGNAVHEMCLSAKGMCAEIAEVVRNATADQLLPSLRALETKLNEYSSVINQALNWFASRQEAQEASMASIRAVAEQIPGFTQQLAQNLVERDASQLRALSDVVAVQSMKIREEMRRPRKIRFIEEPGGPDGNQGF